MRNNDNNSETGDLPHDVLQRIYQQEGCLVLLVDDQELVAYSLKRVLASEEDIVFHYCSNPLDALSSAVEIQPTVIFLDLVMPEISGMEVLRQMRLHPDLKETPIVMLSSEEEAELKAEAFANGANDYITKWPEPIELLARLRYHSRWHINLQVRDEALQALRASQRMLSEKNLELEHIAQQDGLTGIANRRHFDTKLYEELHRAIRNKTCVSLVMADVDHFKLYNDRYGHAEGDECLKRVAQAFDDCVRRTADLCARYGGEEFAVILPDTPAEGAVIVAESICQAVSGQGIPHEASLVADHVTLSIGVSTLFPVKDSTPEELIRAADEALYQAKEQGRNRVILLGNKTADPA